MLRRLFAVTLALTAATTAHAQWSQFGGNARHTGNATVTAQPLAHVLADVIHDPLVPNEIEAGSGNLYVHYAAPLLDGDDVFMSFKEQQIDGPFGGYVSWSVHRLHWENGQLVEKWNTPVDWQPVPDRPGFWEPAFQSVLANGFIYAPAAGGTLLQLDRTNGSIIKRINPFATIDALTFVSGPPAVDSAGNVFYGVFRMQGSQPWLEDLAGSWLVRVTPAGAVTMASMSTLVPDAPKPDEGCKSQFTRSSAMVPPTPTAVPPSIPCGTQRLGVNAAPAIASDGTIYVVTRAHLNDFWSYLVAVNPDLTPKWDRSLRTRFNDGCNVILPPNGTDGGCPVGTTTGVDPWTNEPGSGRVLDLSTASPVVAPDGSIIYCAYTLYNFDQGHLMHFSANGTYLGSYPFGWDTTPAIWQHGSTYSIVTKENHYEFTYRTDPGDFVTQLDPQFKVEWQYRNPSRMSCRGDSCVTEDEGFEWCVNAPAVDTRGTVYVNAEDGNLYALSQGGSLIDRIPLRGPLGAAYTPVAVDFQGRIYAQEGGHLFAVGGVFPKRRAVR
jgi:outer membrane protein assembly factor BamB